MKLTTKGVLRILEPAQGMHLKSKSRNDIYEGKIYLGVNDSPDNYTEVTEEEYQTHLNTNEPQESK